MQLSDIKTSLVVLLICSAATGWAADFIYTPKPAEAESAEGILVREVTVKKGDTLSHLSKHYSGRGHYYPQILLFNEIKNPHRIKPGQVVRVPLSRKVAKEQAKVAPLAAGQEQQRLQPAREAAEVSRKVAEKPATASHAPTKGEKNAYQRAATAFKKGDCDSAIKLFDDFISRYPSSVLLPEASLNRAECYLKLSAK